jgi:hypothetical protein
MISPAPRRGRPKGVLLILAAVFSVAAVGSLLLVAVNLAIGRPTSGDVFIAFLNTMAAVMLWRWRSENERT